MKLVHLPDPDDVIFDFRTMAERVNARLKDEFGAQVRPRARRDQGQMPPHVRRGGARRRSNSPRHQVQAGARLSPGHAATRMKGEIPRANQFCKRLLDVAPAPLHRVERVVCHDYGQRYGESLSTIATATLNTQSKSISLWHVNIAILYTNIIATLNLSFE